MLNKYYKYKFMYLKNKNNQFGSAESKEENISIEPRKCQIDHFLCPNNTLNLGLCVRAGQDCDKDDIPEESYIPEINLEHLTEEEKKHYDDTITRSLRKGYIEDHLLETCNGVNLIREYDHEEYIIPDFFSIITLNIMGIIRGDVNKYEFMKLRIKFLIEEIEKNQYPDILCFQEMSKEVLDELYPPISHIYKFANYQIFESDETIKPFIISKFIPIKTKLIELKGNLGYSNSIGIYEFRNLTIYNIYLQAGSINSLGQKYKWQHYSRCRIQELNYLKKLLLEETKPYIVLGDFNFDLNDDGSIFPEINVLKSIELNDSFKDIHPGDSGLTENTDINTLRWNDKFEEKHYRYDAILYKNLQPTNSILFANNGKKMTCLEDNIIYEKIFVPNKENSNLRINKKIGEQNYYDLFISDHFGVLSNFSF